MARQREIMLGRRDRFAVRVAFLPDPDGGRAATTEQSVSWGSLQVWVNGYNLCAHVEQAEPIDSVHWYLLPILQWLTTEWDFLLHEERLPAKNAAGDAWTSMLRTSKAPPGLPDDAAAIWEDSWHGWWRRHCLLACREGGLVPNVFIRRWRDTVELSWGDRQIAGAPGHFSFNAFHGSARLAPDDVAYVLYGVLDAASQHLREEIPDSPVFEQLVRDVQRLETSDHRRRLGLISGYRPDDYTDDQRWPHLQSLFPPNLPPEVSDAVFRPHASKLVVQGASQAALMFGSLAPTIGDSDARVLAQKLVDYYHPTGESSVLRQFVRNEAIERTGEEAWKQGYRLADDFHEALSGPTFVSSSVDLDGIYQHLGIAIDSIALQDTSIRAVALAGEHHRPAVLINANYQYRDAEPRRFTLGHELCHILHDRSYGAQLALASGPWAPVDVEKRANAFAAMLLMPADLVESVVRKLTLPLDSASAVWQVAKAMQTSFSSTLEHLANLGFLDDTVRDSLRAEMEARAAGANV